jgi:magnesium-transporting ATPase (P-type)
MFLPLAFILTVSAIRAGAEDMTRHRADDEAARRQYDAVFPVAAGSDVGDARPLRLPPATKVASGDLHVGDVVVLHGDDEVPADVLIIHSNAPRGVVFVDTSNIDGETRQKVRSAIADNCLVTAATTPTTAATSTAARVDSGTSETSTILSSSMTPLSLGWLHSFRLRFDEPSRHFNEFKGDVAPVNGNDDGDDGGGNGDGGGGGGNVSSDSNTNGGSDASTSLAEDHMLLRGSIVKSTDHLVVIAVVLFVGDETKVRLNEDDSVHTKTKTALMRSLDKVLIVALFVLVALCIIAGILAGILHDDNDNPFLDQDDSGATIGVKRSLTWLILLAQLVGGASALTIQFPNACLCTKCLCN